MPGPSPLTEIATSHPGPMQKTLAKPGGCDGPRAVRRGGRLRATVC